MPPVTPRTTRRPASVVTVPLGSGGVVAEFSGGFSFGSGERSDFDIKRV